MAESKIILSGDYLKKYVRQFEKRYSATVFERQESGYIHNTVEWGSWVYECLKKNDSEALIDALNSVSERYKPGRLSRETLRSSKNLVISLIATMSNMAAKERIVDNELALTAADVCIMMCEETTNHEDLLKNAYAGLLKISDLMAEYREREFHPLVRQAKEYIYKHLHEEIRVQDIAASLGVSPEHLSRTFHKAEGITLKKHILNERILRARNMLRFSDLKVSEIARYLAFSSQSHFADIFRRETGKTPSEYRRDFSDEYISRI
ncbi:MAG: helix-turn-helix transcriptional regulator [Lachnospiraceae bacterium]|nr:helix-turn-helix transcriptional regulator [Lachnospiraceae bacterium]